VGRLVASGTARRRLHGLPAAGPRRGIVPAQAVEIPVRRFRLSIPLQFVGWCVTLVRAFSLYLLLAVIVWHLGPVHWSVWAVYWLAALMSLLAWGLYSLLDVDGDGAEGVG
jgi:hypothetical protein